MSTLIINVRAKTKNIVSINTEHITLGAFLKLAGIAETGGMARGMIADGHVTVDGDVCTMRGRKLIRGMKVGVFGKNVYVGE
jgi:ribosome-associated protein